MPKKVTFKFISDADARLVSSMAEAGREVHAFRTTSLTLHDADDRVEAARDALETWLEDRRDAAADGLEEPEPGLEDHYTVQIVERGRPIVTKRFGAQLEFVVRDASIHAPATGEATNDARLRH